MKKYELIKESITIFEGREIYLGDDTDIPIYINVECKKFSKNKEGFCERL